MELSTWTGERMFWSPQGTGLGCRFCIARHGIQAHQIPALPQTIAEFHSHMKSFTVSNLYPVLPKMTILGPRMTPENPRQNHQKAKKNA
jgi:hypothetical protein